MSVNILTHCTQKTLEAISGHKYDITRKKNPVQFFIGSSSIQICQASSFCKALRRDCVVARFDTEQKILAWRPSINHHMPCSHDRGYPKKSHLEETVSVTHLRLWRRVTAILEQRTERRLFPSKNPMTILELMGYSGTSDYSGVLVSRSIYFGT